MMGHVDSEERLEESSADAEESGAGPIFRREVASARLLCQQETCEVHAGDLQRETDG